MTNLPTTPAVTEKARKVLHDGSYEKISEKLIRGFYEDFLAPGDTAIDVGVHFGIHLFPMAQAVGANGRVHGIEASEDRYTAISKKAAAQNLSQITLHHVAASHRAGRATFFLNQDFTGRSGLLRNDKTGQDEFRSVSVETNRIDAILADIDALRFMKLDIEGAEAAAIAGAEGLLRKFWPIMIYEGDIEKSIAAFGLSEADVRTVLHDYRHFDLAGAAAFTEGGNLGWNFLAVPRAANEDTTRRIAAALEASWSSLEG